MLFPLFLFSVPEAKAVLLSKTLTFTSTISDGYVDYMEPVYSSAHDSLTGALHNTTMSMGVGQCFTMGQYWIFRSFLFFDTSMIPDSATITSATLSVYICANQSDTDFNVTIQSGQPVYPHDPLEAGDYYYVRYSGDGGSRNTSEISSYDYWNITLTELGWIDVDSTTKLCLRSNREIASTAPSDFENILIYTTEYGSGYAPKLYVTYSYDGYQYSFHGLYDESGTFLTSGVTVSAVYTGEVEQEDFNVNGTYAYNTTLVPLYFHFELGTYDREYWLSPYETSADIYVFNDTLTTYTVSFLDLSGALKAHPFVSAKRYIDGFLRVVEKRRVDVENKLVFNLVKDCKYTVDIGNGINYVYGDLLFNSVSEVTLTLKGFEFPSDLVLAYQYNRIYGYRDNDTITTIYEDTKELLADVRIDITFENGTSVAGFPYWINDTYAFSYPLAGLEHNETYVEHVTIYHELYGTLRYNQIYARGWSVQPFLIPFGSIPNMNMANVIPMIIIIGCTLAFSQINAPTGAFIGTSMATVMTWWGWIEISWGLLVAAIVFTIFFAITYARRSYR